MLAELKKNLKSMVKAQQVLYMLNDLQPAARLIVEEAELEKELAYLKKLKLKFEVADFKILGKNTYGYSGQKIKRISKEKGQIYVYVSKSEDVAKQALNIDWSENHEELGNLQGYPECCCSFFIREHKQRTHDHFPFLNPIVENSRGTMFPYYVNIFKKHRDVTLLTHMPESFDCERSVRLARQYLKVIEKDSMEYARFLTKELKCGIIFNNETGIIILNNYNFTHDKIKYKEFDAMWDNSFTKEMKKVNSIEVPQAGQIAVNGKLYKDHYFLEFI